MTATTYVAFIKDCPVAVGLTQEETEKRAKGFERAGKVEIKTFPIGVYHTVMKFGGWSREAFKAMGLL